MGGFWLDKEIEDQLNLLLTRILVLSSFAAHLVLAAFAGIRRREGPAVLRSLVWLAYQVTDKVPTLAIGKLFLDSPSDDQQLFAFWVPFLLLHLGRPDNISAYTLEDNVLSWRQVLDMSLELGGALYGAYKQKFMGGDWVLGSAFIIMFFLGSYKYAERACVLRRAGLARIRSSNREKVPRRFSHCLCGSEKLDNYDALLDAHGLLCVTMGAFADFRVKLRRYPYEDPFRTCYSDWEDLRKVVEMELSLMYDIMYTKATAIHTWPGYAVRAASPLLTATAFLLFHLHSKAGQKDIDVKITYVLLLGTLLLDARWLLAALASTCTYAFLQDTECGLALCCRSGRWYGLRRLVVSLDPSRISLSGGHRVWAGTVGQHNLLHECAHGTPMKKLDSAGISSVLAEVCKVIFGEEEEEAQARHMERLTFGDAMRFGPEFDALVITWHIATDVFLRTTQGSQGSPFYKKIKAISDYMMFLVAERPEMLPGLKLHSLYSRDRLSLENICPESKHVDSNERETKLVLALRSMAKTTGTPHRWNTPTISEATQYAEVLALLCRLNNAGPSTASSDQVARKWKNIRNDSNLQAEPERSLLVLAPKLQQRAAKQEETMRLFPLEELLDKILLRSWVRLLIFASIRCSRDSHAKQLSRGGELTTIIWILAEHSEIVGIRQAIKN